MARRHRSADSLVKFLGAATSDLHSMSDRLRFREANLAKRQKRLADLDREERARELCLATYARQLNETRANTNQTVQQIAGQTSNLEDDMDKASSLYANHIKALRRIEARKGRLAQEASGLSDHLADVKGEQRILDERNFQAEQTLFECVTQPFSQEQIDRAELSEADGVRTLLELNLRLIHDLRMRISDEQMKRNLQVNEFRTHMNQHNVPVDERYLERRNRQQARNNSIQQRIGRKEAEIREIGLLVPKQKSEICEKKTRLSAVKKELQSLQQQSTQLTADVSPKFKFVLQQEISEIRQIFQKNRKAFARVSGRLATHSDAEQLLKRKLRRLRKLDASLQHEDLELQAQLAALGRREVDSDRRIQEEEFLERQLVQELSLLQRDIASGNSDFDDMLQGQKVAEEPPKFRVIDRNSRLKGLAALVKRRQRRNLSLFAAVRECSEHQHFVRQEVRAVQAKLHLEQCQFEMISHGESPADLIARNSVAIEVLGSRIDEVGGRMGATSRRIQGKHEVLSRIERVNSVRSHLSPFVVLDNEKAVDHLVAMQQRIADSTQRVQRTELLLGCFIEFSRLIQDEIRRWRGSEMDLDRWIAELGNVCKSFRRFGI